ncbi:MAG: hypothetical protein V1799_04610 [bacterium]
MHSNRPIAQQKELREKFRAHHKSIAITALLIVAGGYCFSQSPKTGQTMNTNIIQVERIAALEKRIAAAGDDFVSLTAEDYDLLLSQPIGIVNGFEPRTTATGGILVGVGFAGNGIQQVVQTIFQKIPNIREGDAYVIFDFVKDVNGLDFLNRKERSFGQGGGIDEIEEDESTQLALDIRSADSKSYWFGSRDVKMGVKTGENTFEYKSFSDMNSGTASGKVVMHLPTNITGIALTKGDIGVQKPFADGLLTLKSISKDKISFHYSGDNKKIYEWIIYDAHGKELDQKGASLDEGTYQIQAKNPKSIKIYQAEIVRKEYPFTFVLNKKPVPSALLEGIDAARFSAAMFFQTQRLQTKNVAPSYLDNNDPIVISIKGRAVTDLRRSTSYMDSESPESKLIETQVKAWSEEKKNQLQALGGQSIQAYTAQTLFDVGTFMLVFSSFKEMDQKKIAEEWDIRIQHPDGDNYIAEFWEDSHSVHPEAKNEIGENARYYKMMALLYTLEKDSSVVFHNPFQPVMDSVNR